MPPRKDILVALALLLLALTAVVEGPNREAVALVSVGISVPLAWRRTHPLPAISVVTGSAFMAGVGYEEPSQIAIPLALALSAYTAGRELDPPAAWLGGVLVVGSIWLGLAYTRGSPAEFIFSALMLGAVWAAGHVLRRRDQEVLAAREREHEAVRDERLRIARELHDVVSHSISVVAIQTQAVRRRLRPDQAKEAEDLEAVEHVTREALAEMRRLFGVLRADGMPGSLVPQPGLDQLDALIAKAGVPAELTVRGERVPLSPGLDLAAYRIVQEALTNARRHAGAQRVQIELVYGDPDLAITVTDDGTGANGNGTPGHGLVGMRERVALYGGEIAAENLPEGGFRVAARLPYRP